MVKSVAIHRQRSLTKARYKTRKKRITSIASLCELSDGGVLLDYAVLGCATMQTMLQADLPHALLNELASEALQSLSNERVCPFKSYSNPKIFTQTPDKRLQRHIPYLGPFF